MHHDAKNMIAFGIKGRRQSLCQVRNRLAQTGGFISHKHLLATSFITKIYSILILILQILWLTNYMTKGSLRKVFFVFKIYH